MGSSRMLNKVDWSTIPSITFDGSVIPFSNKVKNLGVIFDSELSWRPHITELSRRLFLSSKSLGRLRNFLPITTKIKLAETLLLPILDYADVSYLDLTQEQLNKLERLQNFCIRFIFGLRKYDHVSEFRKKLKWLPIRFRRNTHILSFLYSILYIPSTPDYLKERFEFLSCSHNLRPSTKLRLNTPVHNSTFYNNSFTVKAIQLWNALPATIRQAKSLPIFKTMIKKYYLSLEYDDT